MDSKSQRKQAVISLKQNLILDAALKVIARDGYQAARLEDIAEEAGFAKASLYHYFPDREALVLELILREQMLIIEQCDEISASDAPVSQKLKNVMKTFFTKLKSHAQFANAMGVTTPSGMSNFAGIAAKHSELFEEMQSRKCEINKRIMSLIKEAVDKGVLTVPIDLGTVSTYIMAIVHSVFMDAYQKGVESYDFDSAVDRFFVFLGPWIREESGGVPAGEGS